MTGIDLRVVPLDDELPEPDPCGRLLPITGTVQAREVLRDDYAHHERWPGRVLHDAVTYSDGTALIAVWTAGPTGTWPYSTQVLHVAAATPVEVTRIVDEDLEPA